MIAITGSTGQLGNLVIQELINEGYDPREIIAIARNPEKAANLAAVGIQVRRADYNDQAAFTKALEGVEKLLLISSSEVGSRFVQHRNVIEAAKAANVSFLAYTSILHADTSPLGLAKEHLATEELLKESGLTYALLRNGWYNENYTMGVLGALKNGGVWGCAGEGRISSASRRDYAQAAAKVLLQGSPKIYELAGDDSYTLTQFASYISEIAGENIPYTNLAQADFSALLEKVGLPKVIAEMLADSENGAMNGGLYADSGALSSLIGRRTTHITDSIKDELSQNS